MLVSITSLLVRVMTTVAPALVSSLASFSPICRLVSYSFTRVHLPQAPVLTPLPFSLEPGARGYSVMSVVIWWPGLMPITRPAIRAASGSITHTLQVFLTDLLPFTFTVMVAAPQPTAVMTPSESTVATFLLLDL